MTLDDLCREHGVSQIDFLKMNIEGAERYAVMGAGDIITRTSHVCIACHDFIADRDPTLATKTLVIDFLQANGFEVILREDHPFAWVRDHVHGVRRSSSNT